jgi:anaerobic magnesium-protoporphyrin IX monomethyl ester cyclase
MNRNVVLVQPRVGDMELFRVHPTPPLGLLCAAANVAADMEARLVDQRTDKAWRNRLAEVIDSGTVAVGITTFTGGMIRNALEAAREVKRLRDVPIIWGGIHPSLLPEQTARHELVDYVVEGEGEEAFARLVKKLAAGADGEGIPGVWFRKGGQVTGTPRAALLDFSELPPPAYSVVEMDQYIQNWSGKRTFCYQSSRGCPCRCTYCYNTVFNLRRWRALPAERVLSELADLQRRYHFSLVYFLDDNFFINHRRALKILAGVKDLGLESALQGVDVETLAELSDSDLDFLESAGVKRVNIGVDSGVDRVRQDVIKKVGGLELVRQQLARFQGRDIVVSCSFIVGLPSETLDEIRRTMDFAMETLRLGDNFRVPLLCNYAPWPGTELFDALEREGFPFPTRLEDWGDHDVDHSHMHQDQPKLRDALERMCFLGKFLDRKDWGFISSGLRVMYNLYRPVAWVRLRSGILRPLPERWFYEMIKGRFA